MLVWRSFESRYYNKARRVHAFRSESATVSLCGYDMGVNELVPEVKSQLRCGQCLRVLDLYDENGNYKHDG